MGYKVVRPVVDNFGGVGLHGQLALEGHGSGIRSVEWKQVLELSDPENNQNVSDRITRRIQSAPSSLSSLRPCFDGRCRPDRTFDADLFEA